jgi:hypothetical protein
MWAGAQYTKFRWFNLLAIYALGLFPCLVCSKKGRSLGQGQAVIGGFGLV